MNQIATTRAWLRRNLFSDAFSAVTTLLLLAATLWWLPGLIDWMLLQAMFKPDAAACEAVNHAGACWGVVAEKYRVILFDRYPYDEQWRPLLATMGMLLAFPLVTVVSLYELTGSLSLALAGDAEWRSFHLEGYLFIGAIYWIGCYAMSRFSRGFETKIGAGGTAI